MVSTYNDTLFTTAAAKFSATAAVAAPTEKAGEELNAQNRCLGLEPLSEYLVNDAIPSPLEKSSNVMWSGKWSAWSVLAALHLL